MQTRLPRIHSMSNNFTLRFFTSLNRACSIRQLIASVLIVSHLCRIRENGNLLHLAQLSHLQGVNRAFPFVSSDEADDVIQAHTPVLFQLVSVATYSIVG